MTSLPDAGRWLVPSFRAVNAVWTGGTTRLSFAASRVVRRVEELAGVQSPNHTPETESKRTLVFEDQAPGPVAAIELRRPQAEVSAEVRGRVELGRGSPILDARIVWQVERGRPHDLDVTLPRTWTADRVEIEGTDLAVPWHTDSLPNGESRVRIPFPTGDWSGKGLALRLHASSDVAGGRGPFALPRVRPIDVAISDESWVAWTEAGLSLQPRSITGLAWIDPDTVSGVPVPQTTEPVASGTNRLLRPTLGWRWIAEEAEGGVDRDLAEAPPASRIELTCRATPGRIETEARILVVDGDQMIRGVDIGLVAPGLAPNAWRFFDAATAEEIRPEPLAPAQRTSVGLGGRGPAWHLSLPTPQRGRVTILARHAASWAGRGDLPLLEVPNRFHWRGELIILSARDLLTSVRPRATRTLDPEVTWESFEQATSAVWTAANRPSAGNPTERRAHAFRYDTSEAAVELSVTALQPSNVAGLVRDALLCTTLTPGYPTRHRLTLQVVPTEADSIAIELPAGSHLERVTRDGVSITPTSESPGFRVALTSLGSSDATRSLVRVVVDYRDSTPLPATSKRVRLPRPAFSMPCLAATWTIQVPSTWKPSEIGPGWSALDRLEEPGARSASPWRELLGRLGWGGAPSPELPAELQGRMSANAPPESSLWDWLVRSDAGSVPIVVDRVALASLGYGPRSPLSPRTDPGSRANDPATWLAGWGLAAVPVGRAVVLTSLKESAGLAEAGRKGTTPRAVAEAVAWGADVTERFESVARWGQENTPRGSEPADTPGSRGAPLGQVSYRFVSPGWPTEGTEIRFVDEALGRTWIGLVAAMVLTVGLFARGAWRLILALGITVALGIASLTSNGGGAWTEWLLPGLAWGTLAVALIVLGGAWKKRRPLTSEQSTVTTRGLVRGSNLLVRAGLFAIPLFPWLIVPVVAQSEEPGRILVLFLYDSLPDPNRPPDRVVMRLADYQRLRQLGESSPAPRPETPLLASAIHRVRWHDPQSIRVESELILNLPISDSPLAPWRIPVEGAREIQASLDGVSVPLRIADGGKTAEIRLEPSTRPGPPLSNRRLVIGRTLTARSLDQWLVASLEINPCSDARVEAEPLAGGGAPELPDARGSTLPIVNGSTKAVVYGPASRLDVRWNNPAGQPQPRVATTVEAQYLWDALPAGDRVRTRMTYRTPGGTSVIRFAVEPGTMLRGVELPGSAEARLEGSRENPVWVARLVPPLPDGSTITVDAWRPLRAEPAATPGARPRRMPRIEPQGVERFSGSVGFRRLPDWIGRLDSVEATDALTDESFVRSWTVLPEDALTLAGAIRLESIPSAENLPTVSTGPPGRRLRVQARARATLEIGRMRFRTDAELTELDGPTWECLAACPAGFRPLQVTADGLTDWSHEATGRLRLRFDGAVSRTRKVVIDGYVPLPEPARTVPATSQEIDAPWVLWPGSIEAPGTLTVISSSPVQAIGGLLEGASSPSPVSPTAVSPTIETNFRVPVGVNLGRLRWDQDPPRVNVLVDSRLTIQPDALDWTAQVRYDVWGRPLDAINLRLPSEWAATATVELLGTSFQQISETRGNLVDWSIRPDRPVWGSQRLVIRATIPFSPDSGRSFPEIRPLGRGGFDSYLRIINATRQGLAVEGSPGLQPIAPTAIPADSIFDSPAEGGSTVRSYRVTRPGWTLRVSKQVEPGRVDETTGGLSVEWGQVDGSIRADGAMAGVATFQVATHTDPFLELEFPSNATPLWSVVNQLGTLPRRTPGGNWQVPLVDNGRNRVTILWEAHPEASNTGSAARSVPIPRLIGAATPVVVRIHAPARSVVRSGTGGLRAIGLERVWLEEAQWLTTTINDSLEAFDRGSRQDAENLVSSLMQLGLKCRNAERAAAWALDASLRDREARVVQASLANRRLQGEIDESLRTAALEDLGRSARQALGIEPSARGPASTRPTPGSEPRLTLRALGEPHAFAGIVEPGSGTPLLVFEPSSPLPESIPAEFGLFGMALLGLGAHQVGRRGRGFTWVARLALIVLCGLSAAAAGPIGLAGALLLAGLGRWQGASV